jgi:hypothetical protein
VSGLATGLQDSSTGSKDKSIPATSTARRRADLFPLVSGRVLKACVFKSVASSLWVRSRTTASASGRAACAGSITMRPKVPGPIFYVGVRVKFRYPKSENVSTEIGRSTQSQACGGADVHSFEAGKTFLSSVQVIDTGRVCLISMVPRVFQTPVNPPQTGSRPRDRFNHYRQEHR